MPPSQCQYSGGCTKFVHHVCTIEWASSNNIQEGGIAVLCREHHPEYTQFSKSSSPKESMTTSSPSHNQQTQIVGNNDSANSASIAVPSDISAANSPENIDKSGEGTVHDVSPTGNVLQVNNNVGQNIVEGIVNQTSDDVQQTDDHLAVNQGINRQLCC
jgi:hypothetical protein